MSLFFIFYGRFYFHGRGLKLDIELQRLNPQATEPRFYSYAPDAWYAKEKFATKTKLGLRWYLLLKDIVPGSENKTFEEQQAMLPKEYEVPSAVAETAKDLLIYKKTGKYVNPNRYARTSDLDSDGVRVYVGYCDAKGVNVNNNWDDNRNDNVGVGACRKSASRLQGNCPALPGSSLSFRRIDPSAELSPDLRARNTRSVAGKISKLWGCSASLKLFKGFCKRAYCIVKNRGICRVGIGIQRKFINSVMSRIKNGIDQLIISFGADLCLDRLIAVERTPIIRRRRTHRAARGADVKTCPICGPTIKRNGVYINLFAQSIPFCRLRNGKFRLSC
jgi:hypothetical protein